MKHIDLGLNTVIEDFVSSFSDPALEPARVLGADRGAVRLLTADGHASAQLAGRLIETGEAPPAVTGDWVLVETTGGSLIVRAIAPRRGTLARRRPGAAERAQLIAANVDLVLIIESLDRGPNARRIERGVALAFGGGAEPVVVLTKADLCPDPAAALDCARGAAPFSTVHLVDCIAPTGLTDLESHLGAGTTSVLIGPSGAGKSTLVNALSGDHRLAVGAVREGDRKGRHTTTRSELVELASGGCVIDTPGIRELGLWIDRDAVESAFAEIEDLAAACRFSDCRHSGEPGCAVAGAVSAGDLEASRLAGYHKLLRETEAHALRYDPARAHEARARDRNFAKMCRAVMKDKDRRRRS